MKSTVASFAALLGVAAANKGYGYGSNWNSTVPATTTAPVTTGTESTVTAIVSSFTTVCPTAGVYTHGQKTWTATESETVTITDCPCTVTTPVHSLSTPVVTIIATSFETYCPAPTTLVYNTKTYTVTKAETVTITDAGECTITSTVVPPKPTWTYEKPSTTSEKPVWSPKPSVYTPVWNGTTTYVTETVSSFTTYCPSPTVWTHGSKTITVSTPTTITITDCPCTITKPVKPTTYYTTQEQTTVVSTYCPPGTHTLPGTTVVVSSATTLTYVKTTTASVPVVTTQYLTKPAVPTTIYPKPETVYITSEISSIYTTFCPSATTIIHQGTTYPVQGPSTVSIPVVQTSVYTSVKPAPPATYVPGPSQPVQPAPPAVTTPVSPEQPPVTTGRVITQISDGQVQVPTGGASTPVAEASATASASPSVQPYTGAAGKMASSGAGVIALIAGAFFF